MVKIAIITYDANQFVLEDSAYINLNSVYLYNKQSNRKLAIEVIRDLRYGNSFIHNKEAYYETEREIALDDDELRKLFVSMNYMQHLKYHVLKHQFQ